MYGSTAWPMQELPICEADPVLMLGIDAAQAQCALSWLVANQRWSTWLKQPGLTESTRASANWVFNFTMPLLF